MVEMSAHVCAGTMSSRIMYSRRELIAGLLALPALSGCQELITIPGKRAMLLHNDRPEDLETPLEYLNTWITPNDVFFVRQHLPRPRTNEATHRVALQGRVNQEMEVSVAELRKLPQYTV